MVVEVVLTSLLTCLLFVSGFRGAAAGTLSRAAISIARPIQQQPVVFTENAGQWDSQVLYRANTSGGVAWITKRGVVYQFARQVGAEHESPVNSVRRRVEPRDSCRSADGKTVSPSGSQVDSVEYLVAKVTFVGSNPDVTVFSEGETDYKSNYFLGDDPIKWRTNVPCYRSVTLQNIYDGVDLTFECGADGFLTYGYSIATSAEFGKVKLDYEVPGVVAFDEFGRASADTKWGRMSGLLGPPRSEDIEYCNQLSISTSDARESHIAESAPERCEDRTIEVVYSTFLGGVDGDWGHDIAVDDSGNAYVTGWTLSSDFPSQNPYQLHQNGKDIFVTKLSGSDGTPVYSTYLGGVNYEEGLGIALDDNGNAYVTGYTYSPDFPTQNPFETYYGYQDVFVTKLSSSGDSLIYSTFIGGGDDERGSAIAVDNNGNAYVTGWTYSSNYPTENPFQNYQLVADAFVTKLSSSGSSLVYSTFLGRYEWDGAYGIAVDSGGHAYVTGTTWSPDFPIKNQIHAHKGRLDAFVAKFSSSGNSLIYSTCLGRYSDEGGSDIEVDNDGCAYVVGWTKSSDFPTFHPYQTFHGVEDVFVTKFSASCNPLIYSTCLGGEGLDLGYSIAIDGSGSAYVTGYTLSSDFPTRNPFQSYIDSGEAFVTKLSNSGRNLIYSTYLGGENDDQAEGIAVDPNGNALVTGYTCSSDFPVENSHLVMYQRGPSDAFVTKLAAAGLCGDSDGNGLVNISDAVYIIAYLFGGGSPLELLESGDADCDGILNLTDAVYLIDFTFSGGPEPCADCPL
jgi:hypothetical protein